jgi:hypothetical protein
MKYLLVALMALCLVAGSCELTADVAAPIGFANAFTISQAVSVTIGAILSSLLVSLVTGGAAPAP